jgi:hypothetical protein
MSPAPNSQAIILPAMQAVNWITRLNFWEKLAIELVDTLMREERPVPP